MTVATSTRRAGPFTGNGSTVDFPFTFKVFAAADLQVFATTANVAEQQTLDVDYSVTLNADQNASPGGVVTMGTAPASGTDLRIQGSIALTQTLSLPQGGNFSPRAVENALDRATM